MSSVEESEDNNRKVTTIYVTPEEFHRIVDRCRASRGVECVQCRTGNRGNGIQCKRLVDNDVKCLPCRLAGLSKACSHALGTPKKPVKDGKVPLPRRFKYPPDMPPPANKGSRNVVYRVHGTQLDYRVERKLDAQHAHELRNGNPDLEPNVRQRRTTTEAANGPRIESASSSRGQLLDRAAKKPKASPPVIPANSSDEESDQSVKVSKPKPSKFPKSPKSTRSAPSTLYNIAPVPASGLPASLPEAKKVSSASALLRSMRLGVQARYQQPKESNADKKARLRKEQEDAKAEQAAAHCALVEKVVLSKQWARYRGTLTRPAKFGDEAKMALVKLLNSGDLGDNVGALIERFSVCFEYQVDLFVAKMVEIAWSLLVKRLQKEDKLAIVPNVKSALGPVMVVTEPPKLAQWLGKVDKEAMAVDKATEGNGAVPEEPKAPAKELRHNGKVRIDLAVLRGE